MQIALERDQIRLQSKLKILFFGESKEATYLFNYFLKKGYENIGFFDNTRNGATLGDFKEGIAFLSLNQVDRVICSSEKLTKTEMSKIVSYCDSNGIELYLLPIEHDNLSTHFSPVFFKDVVAFRLNKRPLDRPFNRRIKRAFDIVFSSLAIVFFLSWFYILAGIIIKLSSKGPILFKQKRNGRCNKVFVCYKFRTMVVNDKADTLQATKYDKRITKVGHFLRKTSLDELPQFINVLLGDMSVIGPRPHTIKMNVDSVKQLKQYNYRTWVKPGITGMAQIHGYRGETESDIFLMKGRVRMDRYYINNWSLGLDLSILAQTIRYIFVPDENTF